ncbi:Uu.00g130600.m01.CDS01 [Anthostomella pinea]|uniref:Uu.00g130600.m01.CDS01 n=1 Tax=Anthostomella pinea TaxID=933095 RepID=A0AAI8VJF8_9PEZI|nr:Uu.00g130600.m01.CDS01 [Anthostomella pinea]
MASTFDVSPEKYASTSHWFKRQLFEYPPATSSRDADLSDKTAIVTGANQGIGLEIARQLLDLGLSKLIVAVRDVAKGQAATQQLTRGRQLPPDAIEVWELDMLAYESITSFAQRASQLRRLDIVVLNAGIYRLSMNINLSTGHEEDIQTNYLSLVLLLILLLPTLKASNTMASPGKVTFVSSDTASETKFKERDANPLLPALDDKTAKWDAQERYGTSKLLGQLFLTEITKRIPPSVAIINGACPGLCHSSSLARDAQDSMLKYPLSIFFRLFGRAPSTGARVIVNAAAKQGELSHGHVIDGCKLRP